MSHPDLDQDPYAAKSICIGIGRIEYARATTSRLTGKHYPAGWVLPGGERTQSETRARNVAMNINEGRNGSIRPYF